MALVNRLDLINEMGDTRTRPELDGNDLNMAVVAARYNQDVTKRLLRGALESLKQHGVADPNVFWVAGSLELPVTALALAETGQHDAIICLAYVIRDHTLQFELIANSHGHRSYARPARHRRADHSRRDQRPRERPSTRSIRPRNNKGAAEAAIEMANLLREIQG